MLWAKICRSGNKLTSSLLQSGPWGSRVAWCPETSLALGVAFRGPVLLPARTSVSRVFWLIQASRRSVVV